MAWKEVCWLPIYGTHNFVYAHSKVQAFHSFSLVGNLPCGTLTQGYWYPSTVSPVCTWLVQQFASNIRHLKAYIQISLKKREEKKQCEGLPSLQVLLPKSFTMQVMPLLSEKNKLTLLNNQCHFNQVTHTFQWYIKSKSILFCYNCVTLQQQQQQQNGPGQQAVAVNGLQVRF